jgi:hypothetical protein
VAGRIRSIEISNYLRALQHTSNNAVSIVLKEEYSTLEGGAAEHGKKLSYEKNIYKRK